MKDWLDIAWAKIRGLRAYLDYFEPTRLRATYAAVLALLAIWGVSIPAHWDEQITGLLTALAVILPTLQSWLTRSAVYSPATHDANVTEALYTDPPGAAPDVTHVEVADPKVDTTPPPPPDVAVQDSGTDPVGEHEATTGPPDVAVQDSGTPVTGDVTP